MCQAKHDLASTSRELSSRAIVYNNENQTVMMIATTAVQTAMTIATVGMTRLFLR
jgi:hypothetical protein